VVTREMMDRLKRKYDHVKKGTTAVVTMLRQKIQSGKTKIRWYVNSCKKVRQNNLFKNNQSQLYKELGKTENIRGNEVPKAEEATIFWKGIWSVEKEHNNDASWLDDVRKRTSNVKKQDEIKISIDDLEFGRWQIGRLQVRMV
jgi:hypothetical protein